MARLSQRTCKTCGRRLYENNVSGYCRSHFPRLKPPSPDTRLAWHKDPCQRCGKYPLANANRSGYCRKCQRSHGLPTETAI